MVWSELGGSPRESVAEGSGCSAERRYIGPWEDRLAFAQSQAYTFYDYFPQSRAVAIEIQPLSEDLRVVNDGGLATYDGDADCIVVVKYGPSHALKAWPFTKPTHRTGTELRFQFQATGQFLTVPSSACRWDDNPEIPVPEDVNSVMMIPMAKLQIQWDYVDNPPIDAMSNLIGKVNSGNFLGNPAETVLFDSYSVDETYRAAISTMHTHRVTVNYQIRYIQTGSGVVGWNHDYREAPAGWAKLLLSDGQPRYKIADFSGTFA